MRRWNYGTPLVLRDICPVTPQRQWLSLSTGK